MVASVRRLLSHAAHRPMLVAAGWVLAVGSAEAVLVVNSLAGVVIHAFIAATILATARRPAFPPIATMALPSLLRIISLSVPLPEIAVPAWYIVVGGTAIAAAAFSMRADGRTLMGVGLRRGTSATQGLIVVSGIPLGLLLTLVNAPALPAIEPGLTPTTILILLSIGPFIAFPEELIFRGILQQALAEKLGPAAVVLVTIVYATMFLGTQSPAATVVMACAGLVFGLARHRSGSILGTTAAHTLMLLTATAVPLIG